MYYILFYKTISNYEELRKPYRQEHLTYAMESKNRGELMLGGAFVEPADGAVLVFKGESQNVAKNFAINDPYVKNGLITNWEVRSWNVVIE